MDINKAIGLLRKALDEIAHLRRLALGNKEFDQWHYKVLDILEVTFGKSSSEYERFARAVRVYLPTYTEADRQKEYNRRLDEYETALKSIVKKYEMLEEEKPIARAESAKATENHDEIHEKQSLGKEIRKHLQGTPEEIAPHIVRVAQEFQFPEGFNCYAEEQDYKASQFSKQFTIYRITDSFTPGVIWGGAKPEELPRTIGTITLQSVPNNKSILIGRYILSGSNNERSYFDSFLKRLSEELKSLGFEKSVYSRVWQWFKSHKILSLICTIIMLIAAVITITLYVKGFLG